jgi:hypothetical protein
LPLPRTNPGARPRKPSKVECFHPAKPATSTVTAQTVFQLDDSELALFDTWAAEQSGTIPGTDIKYWKVDLKKTKKDPLYSEPVQPVFAGPFDLQGVFSDIEYAAEASERGFRQVHTASLWIARALVEQAGLAPPKEADVILVWKGPFFDAYTEPEPFMQGTGYYFDVVSAEADGHPFDGPAFTGFKLKLSRRTEFNPDRRLTAP